ncbi:PREDICTED: exportin-6-like [Acropora digitifera]|uniref:exportin-6-like n=1 Tax=Acropora digitifera TaxID=70779 RepID=UPI00077A61E1|nr:PREDICTED: exportin-6-like [Acropora digitifera]
MRLSLLLFFSTVVCAVTCIVKPDLLISPKHCLEKGSIRLDVGNRMIKMSCVFVVVVLQNFINKQWIGAPPADKTDIRQFLNEYLLSQHKTLPTYIRNKLVKVIVDIGRVDWPHFYPNFFSNIIELLQQPSTTALGLVMLQTTSEEMASPREDLSIARKTEVHRLLLNEVPGILSLLTHLLDRVLEKHRRLATTVTPPPSPTHGMSPVRSSSPSVSGAGSLSIFSSTAAHDQMLQGSSNLAGRLMSNSPMISRKNLGHPLPPLDSESEEISILVLKCLAHLFSWIPLSSTITPSLVSTVFYLAEFGCNVVATNSNSSVAGNAQLGVSAMSCINELLSKNCVPVEFEEFLLKLFQQTFQLLQRITKDTGAQAVDNLLTEQDEGFLNKFTEFLRLFVSIHLRRFENSSHFPVLELLMLLFKYTFKQPELEGFFACLDIWGVFLDYLISKVANARSDKLAEAEATVSRYKEVLLLLVTELLKKIQFRHNQTQLEELDDESLDDDSETEWQSFQRHCLEIVAKLAELLPGETFTLLFPLFSEYCDVYTGLGKYLTKSGQGLQLGISAEIECRQLHCTLRDLTTMERALGRLSEHFIGEVNFANRFSDGEAIVDRLGQISLFGTQSQLYEVETALPSVLLPDLIEVHAQGLAALQAYCHWMAQYYLETHRQQQHQEKFVALISQAVDALVPLLNKDVPPRISLPASHLLNSIASTVRPSFMTALEKIQNLFHDVNSGALSELPLEVQTLVIRSLSNALVLPWPSKADNEQEWDVRSQSHQRFIENIKSPLKGVVEAPGFSENKQLQESAKTQIHFTLHVLGNLMAAVAEDQVTKTKVILCHSIADVVQLTLTIFPLFIHHPDTTDKILGFLLTLFESLKVQIGSSVTEQIVQQLLHTFTRQQLSETLLHESSAGSRVINKFLKILQLLVQEPAASFKAFLPNIIGLCMEQLYPIIIEQSCPDIKCEFYELLHQLLLHNWRFFFRSSLLAKMSAGEDTVENQPQFITIMQAFGQSFLQPDIAIFKQNLEALENLNSKCKLYQKTIFKNSMLLQFVNVLLQALVYRSHDLLQEEITITLYNMAAVDFESFYSIFLPQFLGGCEGLTDSQSVEVLTRVFFFLFQDLPSFTQSTHQFVGDLRYYRLCNSSLPSGTIKFQ